MTESWTVDWPSIETRGDLLVLMFTQLTPHVDTAIESGQQILSGEFNVRSTSSFLFSAAVVGDFFWPSPQRRRPVATAFPKRDRDMRHLLGLSETEPSVLDQIRNDLAHVDERLEELFLADPDGPLLAWGNGAKSPEGTRRYMNFDPDSGVLHSLDTEVDVAELVEWYSNLRQRISRVTFQLMMRSHRIGTSKPSRDP